jgi:hypothetical protein
VTPHQWPLRSYLELGALPTAVPCARLHARHLLWEWGLNETAADTELLVSELVTNAVKATAGQHQAAIRLQLSSDTTCVRVEVWDADPTRRYSRTAPPISRKKEAAACSWSRRSARAGTGTAPESHPARSSGANWKPDPYSRHYSAGSEIASKPCDRRHLRRYQEDKPRWSSSIRSPAGPAAPSASPVSSPGLWSDGPLGQDRFHINAAQVHIRWIFRQDYRDALSRRTLPMPGPDCWARTMAG